MTPVSGGYQVLMIDPPWPQKKGGKRAAYPNQGRDLDYSTMSMTEIFALLDSKIFPLATPAHSVFLWAIEKFLPETLASMADRGYKRHATLIWDKENGIAPAFTVRYSHEYLAWFYKSPMVPVSTEVRGKIATVFREKPREHSRKPDTAYRIVERLYPSASRLDVFSRQPRHGWDQFGDQVDFFCADTSEGAK